MKYRLLNVLNLSLSSAVHHVNVLLFADYVKLICPSKAIATLLDDLMQLNVGISIVIRAVAAFLLR